MNMTASPAIAESAPAERAIDFRSRDFLLSHVRDTLAFYAPNARDPSGGFFHFFKDDGSVYDRTTRHLVSSTRFVFNYAMAYRHFGDTRYQDDARHAFRFLRDAHWDAANEGYDWEIEWRDGAKRTLAPQTSTPRSSQSGSGRVRMSRGRMPI